MKNTLNWMADGSGLLITVSGNTGGQMQTPGWGAWSIETGWTQAWIPTVLAMRELK